MSIAAYELLYCTGLVREKRLVFYACGMAFAVTIWSCYNAIHAYAVLGVMIFVGLMFAELMMSHVKMTFDKVCMVLKESYGNALAPFLSTIYHKVYVLDFRYFTEDFTAFVKNNGVQDVLLLNNISATRNGTLVNKLDGFVGK